MEFKANRLVLLRKMKGITQAQMAEALGKPQQLIAGWEAGKFYPSITSLTAICKKYDVAINYFFEEENDG